MLKTEEQLEAELTKFKKQKEERKLLDAIKDQERKDRLKSKERYRRLADAKRRRERAKIAFSKEDIELVKLLTTDETFKEISFKMDRSFLWVQRKVNEMSNMVDARGRLGIVVYALKNKIIKLEEI